MTTNTFDHARAAFLAAGQTLRNERRDFPEWHLGRPHYALWAVDVDLPDVRQAVAGAEAHLDGLLLDGYRRQPHITLALCGFPTAEPQHPDDLMRHHTLRLFARNNEADVWQLHCPQLPTAQQHWRGAPPARLQANSPELLIQLARAGAGITAVPDYFALPWVRQGGLRRILPTWSLPSHTAWAVFPGRRLMPAKTRAFIDMLEAALSGLRSSA